MEFNLINPLIYPSWEKMLRYSNKKNIFFHTSMWARVLVESYNYTPWYFTLEHDNELLISVPLMEVSGFLTGKRGVSLPFTDYCYPIFKEQYKFADIIDYIIEYGKKKSWKYLEIRGIPDTVPDTLYSEFFYKHHLGLTKDINVLYKNLKDSNRRNIKKALQNHIEIEKSNSLESMLIFYKLHCLTRKRHGIPPQPLIFFRKIFEYIISQNFGYIFLAKLQGVPIGAAVFFHFGKEAIYKFGASDMSYQHLRMNNLLMWEAINWYADNSYDDLCFGKTDPNNSGLRQFKLGWGTEETKLNYIKYDITTNEYVKNKNLLYGFHNKVFRNLPLCVLQKVGSLMYKHIG